MNSNEKAVLDWLGAQEGAMVALLERLVNTDGGSYDKAGVDAVGDHIKAFLEGEGVGVETVPVAEFGDALRATVSGGVEGAGANSTILLMGHRDTVFPSGEPARRPFKIIDGIAYGPGVADMKAGLVMNAFVMAAFKRHGGAPAPLVGLFTSDEEIGSPACRPIIEAEGRRARAVFNSEPGRPGNLVVTGRKGGVFMRLTATGKPAHSGANFAEGISAIEELARKIFALYEIKGLDAGTTINVGTIGGGQTVNTVAPSATCEIDLRYVTQPDREAAMAAIRKVAETTYVAGTTSLLEIASEFYAMVETPGSDALYQHYAACADDLGAPVKPTFTGGCSDAGFTAAVGAPTICAVGPIGGKAHTPDEFLEVASLVPRAQNVALAIMRLEAPR
ncbi:M20 family metallopeptidase [Variibacter gotjawalensis]|nr:M20 family metallopeptidase [Variibacter gotjawalensis]NIK47150.1 glutamate carboxypeptidase [Variibacter gotjawalensis]